MRHYHIYIGYGAPVTTSWFLWGNRVGYTRTTAKRIGKNIAGGKPTLIRQCEHAECDVLAGFEESDWGQARKQAKTAKTER